MSNEHMERASQGPMSSDELTGSPVFASPPRHPASIRDARVYQKKRVCFDTMATAREHSQAEYPPKRLRPNGGFTMQAAPPPDPLDADPLDLMASQSHLLEPAPGVPARTLGLERGASSNCQHLAAPPPPLIQELQSGFQEKAGSNGKVEDKGKVTAADEEPSPQQLQQLKKHHRLQLQERNRQICHLQEDREKLKRSLRKAESDLRDAQETVMCTVCHKNKRNCLILPCLHFLLCAGCLQQHTTTCPFCPACNTKVSGLMMLLTTV